MANAAVLSSADVTGGTDSLGFAWSVHKAKHGQLCANPACGHAKWQHDGLDGASCTHLGACLCPGFTRSERPVRLPTREGVAGQALGYGGGRR